jgi:hypothetical protein
MNYDKRHGGPYDRGSADAWYGREWNPHYFLGETYTSHLVTKDFMSVDDLLAYTAGYKETPFAQKEW